MDPLLAKPSIDRAVPRLIGYGLPGLIGMGQVALFLFVSNIGVHLGTGKT